MFQLFNLKEIYFVSDKTVKTTTMTQSLSNVTFLVLCIVAFFVVEAKIDPEKGAMIQNIFRQFLKIRPGGGKVSKELLKRGPPKHMLELYHKFTEGGASKRTFGNTVRNILPCESKYLVTIFIFYMYVQLLLLVVVIFM